MKQFPYFAILMPIGFATRSRGMAHCDVVQVLSFRAPDNEWAVIRRGDVQSIVPRNTIMGQFKTHNDAWTAFNKLCLERTGYTKELNRLAADYENAQSAFNAKLNECEKSLRERAQFLSNAMAA